MKNKVLNKLSIRSITIISIYILLTIGMTIICFFPLISELSYRKAHLLSTEAKVQNFKFFKRFDFSFEEFEKAIIFYPWETHYVMEYIKELEIYSSRLNSREKQDVYKKIINLLDRIQFIDPINPWYHSKRASILSKQYELTKD